MNVNGKYYYLEIRIAVVENKIKLLRPILSRFCDIFVPLPVVNNKSINLHIYNINDIKFMTLCIESMYKLYNFYKYKLYIKQNEKKKSMFIIENNFFDTSYAQNMCIVCINI